MNFLNIHVSLIIFTFYTFLVLGLCNSSDTNDLERPGKNLCTNKSEDCSNQVKFSDGTLKASCFMKYLMRNSSECSDSEFRGSRASPDQYGAVNLIPFAWYHNGVHVPMLNITFTKIRWKSLRLRYLKPGSTETQFCRQFDVSDNIDLSSVISFDCLWVGSSSGAHFKFQYMVTSKQDHTFLFTYLLQIPSDSDVGTNLNVKNYKLFMIIDQTFFPHISLKLLVPPKSLNVTSAKVILYHKEDTEVHPLEQWVVDLTNKTEGEFIEVGPYKVDETSGVYYFNASFKSGLSKLMSAEASTPNLVIKGFQFRNHIWIAFFVLTSSIMGLLMYKLRKKKTIPNENRCALFIYDSNYPSHVDTVYNFKDFLEENCNLTVLLDLIDIPKKEPGEPLKWYCNAFERSDYVLVFASPADGSKRGIHEDNIYHKLSETAFRLLENALIEKHKFVAVGVTLPGCSWHFAPPGVSGLVGKKISLPEKLHKLLKILNVPPLPNGGSALLAALQETRKRKKQLPLKVIVPSENSLPLDSDDEGRDLKLPPSIQLNLDNPSTSEEEDSDDDIGSRINLTKLELQL